MRRRGFLAGVTGLVAWGAFRGVAEAPPGPTVAPEPAVSVVAQTGGSRLAAPVLAADGPALSLSLSVERVFQGGALFIHASPATSGDAVFLGRAHPLVPLDDGVGGFVGISTADDAGEALLEVRLTDPLGALTLARTITILETEWTVWIVEPTDFPDGTGELLDPAVVQAETDLLVATYAGMTPRQWNGTWASPIGHDPTPADISGYFGEQRSFDGGPPSGHHGGTDFGLDAGMPIFATQSGTVVIARELAVRGNMVIIDHGSGVFSGYAHMESIAVAEGDLVSKGHVLGAVGTTGLSTGPHLHWEVAVSGVLVDGLRWLDGSQGF